MVPPMTRHRVHKSCPDHVYIALARCSSATVISWYARKSRDHRQSLFSRPTNRCIAESRAFRRIYIYAWISPFLSPGRRQSAFADLRLFARCCCKQLVADSMIRWIARRSTWPNIFEMAGKRSPLGYEKERERKSQGPRSVSTRTKNVRVESPFFSIVY